MIVQTAWSFFFLIRVHSSQQATVTKNTMAHFGPQFFTCKFLSLFIIDACRMCLLGKKFDEQILIETHKNI